MHQVLDRRAPARAHRGRVRVQPVRVAVPRELIEAQLAHEPAQHRGRGGRQHEAEGAAERGRGEVGEGGLGLVRARELDGLQRVDEAGQHEEERDPRVALGQKPEDGPLPERGHALDGAAAGQHDAPREAEDDVRGDDVDGGDAAETLTKHTCQYPKHCALSGVS